MSERDADLAGSVRRLIEAAVGGGGDAALLPPTRVRRAASMGR
jgi:hypothetical protein